MIENNLVFGSERTKAKHSIKGKTVDRVDHNDIYFTDGTRLELEIGGSYDYVVIEWNLWVPKKTGPA